MTILLSEKVPYIKTPLVNLELSQKLPCNVLLKIESIQPSGSYKIRGLSHHIKKEYTKLQETYTGKDVVVVAASGGNAGIAVSLSARFFNLRSMVVVPTTTSHQMVKKIELYGAKVLIHGDNIGEADEYARTQVIPSLEKNEVSIYCHPYDLPNIWEGHSSLVDEIVYQLQKSSQLDKLKGIVCSIGGGGLYNGLVQGLERYHLSHVPILTTETDSCPTFQDAIDADAPVQMKSFKSIATSLACPFISLQSLVNYKTHPTKNILVSDSDAAEFCIRFANDSNLIVEPACGVALCSVYKDLLIKSSNFFGNLEEDDIVVIVICGGNGTTIDDLNRYKNVYQL